MRWWIALALVAAFASRAGAQPESVVLATGDDFPPFVDQYLPDGGLTARIVARAFEEAEFVVSELRWLPWQRAISLTRQGQVDATFPWSETDDRREQFLFSDPILVIPNYAWVRETDDFAPTSIDDVRGRRFCRPVGYATLGALAEFELQGTATREAAGSMADCFRMLMVGRVDFVSANRFDAQNAISAAGLANGVVVRLDLMLAEARQSLIVGRANPRADTIIAAFNAGLGKLRATGEIDRLVAKHGLLE